MAHVLIVGGSKDLAEVALFLAEHDNTVTIVSNHSQHLSELMNRSHKRGTRINPMLLDVQNKNKLYSSLVKCMDQHGPIVLAINWLSPAGESTIDLIARLANSKSPLCRFFQVVRSGDEFMADQERFGHNPFATLPKVLYRTIFVGVDHVDEEIYRPLPPTQVCNGIIDAIRDDRRSHHIGWTESLAAKSQSA